MFFESKDVSVSGYENLKYISQAAPVIDRLSSLEETGHHIFCTTR